MEPNCPKCNKLTVKLPKKRMSWMKVTGAYFLSEIVFWIVLIGIVSIGAFFGGFGILIGFVAAYSMYYFLTKKPNEYKCMGCDLVYKDD
ncbi:hypothetical protein EOL70_10055 [Leucothrix sargassi]|nr:hypothetical protein EOL70_10055 [Leucothrix sargassi]